MELWLENYLSLFFNFKLFGNLNWLAIPLLIYFLVTIKKRKRWEIAIAFVFIFSCLFLSSKKGQGNPRYLLTLYPFVLSTIFLLGWEYIKKRSHRFHLGIFIICTIAILFNFYHFRETYKFYLRYKVIAVDDYFPHDLLKFINNNEDLSSDNIFLVCSQRDFFYYYGPQLRYLSLQPKVKTYNYVEVENPLFFIMEKGTIKLIDTPTLVPA